MPEPTEPVMMAALLVCGAILLWLYMDDTWPPSSS